jgi:hypothetical protein
VFVRSEGYLVVAELVFMRIPEGRLLAGLRDGALLGHILLVSLGRGRRCRREGKRALLVVGRLSRVGVLEVAFLLWLVGGDIVVGLPGGALFDHTLLVVLGRGRRCGSRAWQAFLGDGGWLSRVGVLGVHVHVGLGDHCLWFMGTFGRDLDVVVLDLVVDFVPPRRALNTFNNLRERQGRLDDRLGVLHVGPQLVVFLGFDDVLRLCHVREHEAFEVEDIFAQAGDVEAGLYLVQIPRRPHQHLTDGIVATEDFQGAHDDLFAHHNRTK